MYAVLQGLSHAACRFDDEYDDDDELMMSTMNHEAKVTGIGRQSAAAIASSACC